ncbi:Multicopper oxidase mco [Roseivivax jejudonensis]|uniref:Multicopper oxidase mco n=1 Tax=Roseivivax jejudonensis TaxID=1529041 RepID=A0A1X6Y631_9RHOB|nr:multicopper oxidase family protein [Roseivivax jejudonensis]SLN11363.1 Multicopper oxidase mco [Roseivivax jejudonensis]
MTVSRRSFLAGSAGVALTLGMPARAETERLVAGKGVRQLLPDAYPATSLWTYDGSSPGPVLRFRQGDRLRRRFENALDQSSTIHWHGLRLPNEMDGVPGVTQDTVPPGGTFDYAFDLPDAGTYWYHPHDRSWEQVGRGLSGALIVEEPEPPEVDFDEVLLVQDWRLTENGEIAEDFGSLHDRSHAGRIGNWLTANGLAAVERRVGRHARLRVRVINAASARILRIGGEGVNAVIVALDGQPLRSPEPLTAPVPLGPGARADLIVDVTAEGGEAAFLYHLERDGGVPLLDLTVDGDARTSRLGPVAPLAPNAWPDLALGDARAVDLRMEGGAMGGLSHATLGGETLSLRELAARGKVWAFNGAVDMHERPLAEVRAGETLRIRMVNDSAWPHAMHLHGHHFRQIGEDGTAGALRDTALVAPDGRAEIAFVAERPGDWLLHCHMLGHAASGMMTRVRVV